MMDLDLTCSIVLFRNDPVILKKTIDSVLDTKLKIKIYLIDNSPTDDLKFLQSDIRIIYIFNGTNIGFGAGHNVVLNQPEKLSTYHLILNPDVHFKPGTLEVLKAYMNDNSDVGMVMPKVVNFENELQYLCKRLPTPVELMFRRFLPGLNFLINGRLFRYEMRDKNYDSSFDAPTLSGCFMFVRTKALEVVGNFDERFFMYMEDIDLSRRIAARFRNVYNAKAIISHGHAKDSYKKFRLLVIHVKSAISYFNKWGWFFDRERRRVNKEY
jgi:GT2 family glycosyltransferase